MGEGDGGPCLSMTWGRWRGRFLLLLVMLPPPELLSVAVSWLESILRLPLLTCNTAGGGGGAPSAGGAACCSAGSRWELLPRRVVLVLALVLVLVAGAGAGSGSAVSV